MKVEFPSYSVLIPAYNARQTIALLLEQLRSIDNPPAHIFVVDDGSTDDTSLLAKNQNAAVIRLEKNQGKGFALQKGFKLFETKTKDNYLICMDADFFQYSSETYRIFVSFLTFFK